jgi:hypothetical protein
MATASQPTTPAAEFPIRRVRFVNGRTWHRTRRPAEWHHQLEAACGKTGYLASGYGLGPVGDCRGCQKAIGAR